MVEIDAAAFRNINFIVTKLQELSLYLFADGLIRQSKELDEAINTIKGVMEHDVCIDTDCSKKGEQKMQVKIVFKDECSKMVALGFLKNEFTNVIKVIPNFEDKKYSIICKSEKYENKLYEVEYDFDMISSITIDEAEA